MLYGVTWQGYEKFLEAVGDGSTKLNYDRGTLEITVPSGTHERWKRCIDYLIVALGSHLKNTRARVRFDDVSATSR